MAIEPGPIIKGATGKQILNAAIGLRAQESEIIQQHVYHTTQPIPKALLKKLDLCADDVAELLLIKQGFAC